jgi:Na+/melibiose symporter-like transporter
VSQNASLFVTSPAFRHLASSNLLAHLAEQVGTATILMTAVAVLGTGAGGTGTIQALATLPFLLLAIPIGTLTDRTSPRAVMVAGELVRVAALAGIAALLVADRLSLAWLAALATIGSTGTVAYTIGAPSIISETIERGNLLRANAAIELTRSLAIASGPALAGAVIGWTGAGPALGIATGSSVLALALLLRLRSRPRAAARATTALADITEGARWTLSHPLLRPIIVTAVLFNTAWFCMQGVFVAYAIDTLGYSVARVGWTMAGYGVGMIAGAAISRRVFELVPVGTAICIGPLAGFAAMATMATSLIGAGTIAPPIAFFLLGAGPILWTISTTTLRQSITPFDMLGRVSAIIVTATAGARPVGAGIGALAATTLGVDWAILLCVAGMAAQAAVITTSPVAKLADYPGEPLAGATATKVAGAKS